MNRKPPKKKVMKVRSMFEDNVIGYFDIKTGEYLFTDHGEKRIEAADQQREPEQLSTDKNQISLF